MARIRNSVGQGQRNSRRDVTIVQSLLNRHMFKLQPRRALRPDGKYGSKTQGAIDTFQMRVLQLSPPSGIINPDDGTMEALNQPANLGERFQYPMGPQELLADLAVPYIGATEARGNRMGDDPRMREIFEADRLAPGGQTDGYPWCAAFVCLCVQKLIEQSLFYGHVMKPRTPSVRRFRRDWAASQGCLVFPPSDMVNRPHKGDIVEFQFSHIGIVTSADEGGVYTIEGNTNEAGSREGTTVRRKHRTNAQIMNFIRLPIPLHYDMENLVCVA